MGGGIFFPLEEAGGLVKLAASGAGLPGREELWYQVVQASVLLLPVNPED